MTGVFAGATYDPKEDEDRLSAQILRVYDAMKDGDWRTLAEIHDATGDPPASISAQLRHLRKPRFGAYLVEKRPRGLRATGLYEYRVLPPTTGAAVTVRARRTGFLAGLMHAAKIVAKNPDLACVRAEIKAELIKASKKGKAT